MDKLNLKQDWKALYTAGRKPSLLDIPARKALLVDGEGAPGGESFAAAITELYGVAYTLKFTLKLFGIADYPALPLEALWDIDAAGHIPGDASLWRWTALIAVPDIVDAKAVRAAATEAARKHPLTTRPRLRLGTIREGRAAQVMHVGPYATETGTIEMLQAFIASEGLVVAGRHHEVYLSDPRRTAPERLRTIIRYPVKRAPRRA